jgi:hypothetical protein
MTDKLRKAYELYKRNPSVFMETLRAISRTEEEYETSIEQYHFYFSEMEIGRPAVASSPQ